MTKKKINVFIVIMVIFFAVFFAGSFAYEEYRIRKSDDEYSKQLDNDLDNLQNSNSSGDIHDDLENQQNPN